MWVGEVELEGGDKYYLVCVGEVGLEEGGINITMCTLCVGEVGLEEGGGDEYYLVCRGGRT